MLTAIFVVLVLILLILWRMLYIFTYNQAEQTKALTSISDEMVKSNKRKW